MKRGTIEPHKLFKLYRGLYEQRSSGWLQLNHRSGARKIYLERGYPAFTVSAVPTERLLPRLVRDGICSTSEAARIERRVIEAGDSIERALIEANILSSARLEQVRVDLTSEVVWRSLSWSDGEFGWVADGDQPRYSMPVDVITLLGIAGQLVLTDAERADLWSKVQRSRAKSGRLTPEEVDSLSALLGDRDASALTRGAVIDTLALAHPIQAAPPGAPPSQEALRKASLCGLLISGLFKLSAPPKGGAAQVHEAPSARSAPSPSVSAPLPPPPPPVAAIPQQAQVTRPAPPQARADRPAAPMRPQSPQRLRASATENAVPPEGFIDERARVRRSSADTPPSHHSAPEANSPRTPRSTAERGAPRDRRIIKPPENWRRFSIGNKSDRGAPSLAPAAQPKSASPVTPPAPPVTPPAPPVTPPAPTVTPPASPVTPPAPPVTPPAPPVTPPAPPVTPPAPPVTPPTPTVTPPAPTVTPPAPPKRRSETQRKKRPAPEKIQARIDVFLKRYAEREELNHYELLGVERDVTSDDLRRVFKKLLGELHIDQYLRFDLADETLEILKQLYITINRAHQVLNDPEQRQEYDLSLQLGSSGDGGGAVNAPQRDLNALLQAEQLTRDAINFVKRGKLEIASEKVEAALAINADDPLTESVSLYIGGLKAKSSNASIAVIRQYIDRLEALVVTYENREEPFLYLGVLYGHCQEYTRGLKAVERALAINPHFAEANSQLRHLQRLSEEEQKKSSKRGGLFRRR